MIYIGDLSKTDTYVLTKYAGNVTKSLEFGPGASTQIILQANTYVTVDAFDTEREYLELAAGNLRELGLLDRVNLRHYSKLPDVLSQEYDLIFIDGSFNKRHEFAVVSFPLLRVGGVMIFHDTRRAKDAAIVASILATNFCAIESVQCNESDSNLAIIKKQKELQYSNWNRDERRMAWQYNPKIKKPSDWKDRLSQKLA